MPRAGRAAAKPAGERAVFPKSLGEWIAEMRLAHHKTVGVARRSGAQGVLKSWSRLDLAERAGISEATLLRIEADDELPRVDVMEGILRALNLYAWQDELVRAFWLARS